MATTLMVLVAILALIAASVAIVAARNGLTDPIESADALVDRMESETQRARVAEVTEHPQRVNVSRQNLSERA